MTSRFFTCTVPECRNPAVRAGGCTGCRRYLCTRHLNSALHCHPKRNPAYPEGPASSVRAGSQLRDGSYAQIEETAELHCLQEQINDAAVCRLASRLNGDKSCSVEHPAAAFDAFSGRANYKARIRFHDGSPPWLIQVLRVTVFIGCPLALIDYLIRSEYATLKFLEGTAVPAPRAFAYGVTGHDHGVGISFLLMEELGGKLWNRQTATEHEKARVWRSLANIMVDIEKYPFSQAGSLILHANNFQLSAVASDKFLILDPRGPFLNSAAYNTAFANQHLELIADRQLYAEYPVQAYLVYRFLKDSITQLGPYNGNTCPEQFFLKHVGDEGNHLLVDDNLNITGIIDWQMARVVPRREAFGPSLITADMARLSRGQVSLSTDDILLASALRERGLVATHSSLVVLDEKVRRFFWGLAMQEKWFDALPLAQAILKVFGVNTPWTDWEKMALEKYKNDKRLQQLITHTTTRLPLKHSQLGGGKGLQPSTSRST